MFSVQDLVRFYHRANNSDRGSLICYLKYNIYFKISQCNTSFCPVNSPASVSMNLNKVPYFSCPRQGALCYLLSEFFFVSFVWIIYQQCFVVFCFIFAKFLNNLVHTLRSGFVTLYPFVTYPVFPQLNSVFIFFYSGMIDEAFP